MSRKTHKNLGQSSLLPLQLNKVKLTLHRHSFYFNYLQSADNKFLMYPNGWKQFPYNPYAPEKA